MIERPLYDVQQPVVRQGPLWMSDNASNVRYGDYFSARNASGPVTANGQGLGYSTLGYSVTQVKSGKTCAVGGCNVALQHILFGRNEELFPPPPDSGPK